MTKQRKVILDILRNTKSHPTADWVYEKVKQKIPNISLVRLQESEYIERYG